MGKLHSLKRAIKRNPDQWKGCWMNAVFSTQAKMWLPCKWGNKTNSYRRFIIKTLAEIAQSDRNNTSNIK